MAVACVTREHGVSGSIDDFLSEHWREHIPAVYTVYSNRGTLKSTIYRIRLLPIVHEVVYNHAGRASLATN